MEWTWLCRSNFCNVAAHPLQHRCCSAYIGFREMGRWSYIVFPGVPEDHWTWVESIFLRPCCCSSQAGEWVIANSMECHLRKIYFLESFIKLGQELRQETLCRVENHQNSLQLNALSGYYNKIYVSLIFL